VIKEEKTNNGWIEFDHKDRKFYPSELVLVIDIELPETIDIGLIEYDAVDDEVLFISNNGYGEKITDYTHFQVIKLPKK